MALVRRLGVLGLVLASTPAWAQAQGAPPPAGPAGAGAAGGSPAVPSAAAQAAPAETAAPAEKKGPSVPTAGYSYSDKPTRTAPIARPKARATLRPGTPTANLPGFETLADGGSRFFVQLSASVPVEEKRAPGTITYVLKGAHVRVWNNTNALVTVHFNTPASRAKLVPRGNDLLFVVDLRADAAPAYKMTDGPDRSAVLTVDFAKGDYGGPDVTPNARGSAPPSTGKTTGKTPAAAPTPPPDVTPTPPATP